MRRHPFMRYATFLGPPHIVGAPTYILGSPPVGTAPMGYLTGAPMGAMYPGMMGGAHGMSQPMMMAAAAGAVSGHRRRMRAEDDELVRKCVFVAGDAAMAELCAMMGDGDLMLEYMMM